MMVKEKVPTPQTSHDQGLSGSLGDVFSKQRQTAIIYLYQKPMVTFIYV